VNPPSKTGNAKDQSGHDPELECAREALSHRWGREGELHRLAGEADLSFRVEQDGVPSIVLKVAAADTDRRLIDLEMEILARCEGPVGGPRLPLPSRVPGRNGQDFESVQWPDGSTRIVRALTWMDGRLLARARPAPPGTFRGLGAVLGTLAMRLDGFSHPGAELPRLWDPLGAADAARTRLTHVRSNTDRALLGGLLDRYGPMVDALAPELPRSVIHGDANDWNVLISSVTSSIEWGPVTGLFDLGDALQTARVGDAAIAAAYAILDEPHPLPAVAELVAGFNAECPLTEPELRAIWPLALLRLCASVAISAERAAAAEENPYLSVSEQPAWAALRMLGDVHPDVVLTLLRGACGLEASPEGAESPTAMPLPDMEPDVEALLERRETRLGPMLSVSYRRPLSIVRGAGPWLYDGLGGRYLDCVNNVAHVGHEHPAVVRAGTRQMRLLNTNTRYLHPTILEYADRLAATLPTSLDVIFLVCSGSEANELALRMARAASGGKGIVVLDGAYHGNTTSLVEVSPYKFDGPGGDGRPPHVRVAPMPDSYRGQFRGSDPDRATKYAAGVAAAFERLRTGGEAPAAFLYESLLSCGGQIELPEGYLRQAQEAARAAGAVSIADEVQVGFGRAGSHFWGFQTQGVVPDIVTMGKPIGNGHPLGAVATTRAVAEAFDNGMEYFNTFGGNPVSCAIGLAVLDVIKREGLQGRALSTGAYLLHGLKKLAERHRLIGDVRGRGLFLGVELVRDRTTLEPAADEATRVVEAARELGVLLSTDGPLHNVIKIKPPLAFGPSEADQLIGTLDRVLGWIR